MNTTNYGIMGNVNASAVAVGPHAKAVVNQAAPATRAEFDALVQSLRHEIAAIKLPPENREVVHESLNELQGMAGESSAHKREAAPVMDRILNALKTAGVLVQGVAALHNPLLQLAAWFHIPGMS
jgi:hypothetical protein